MLCCVCQEPEDDPRYFVYLWVVYGPHGYEYKANSRSRIVLYQLNYQDRERNADVAFVYRVRAGELQIFFFMAMRSLVCSVYLLYVLELVITIAIFLYVSQFLYTHVHTHTHTHAHTQHTHTHTHTRTILSPMSYLSYT